jgi:predicted RNA methylase
MRIRTVDISDEVAGVLRDASWSGDVIRLPERQLDRKLYDGVAKTLNALGMKWSRKLRGFACTAGEWGNLTAAVAAGVVVDQKKTMEQFFTPRDVATRLIAAAEIGPVHRVLEPSAGGGALIEAVAVAQPSAIIHAIEQDFRLVDLLRTVWGIRITLAQADFLTVEPDEERLFDRVVMNPPFSRGQDMAHVTHALAFLQTGGCLVSIMSTHWCFAEDRQSRGFRTMCNAHAYSWDPLPDRSFASSGTDVSTGILTITKTREF